MKSITQEHDKIVLDHGTGAKLSSELVSLIAKNLGSVYTGKMEDSAVVDVTTTKIAMTTDSFVVTPLFFGNGDIGKISVCGTVNDIAVSGATPLYLTLSMVIEVGFPIDDLIKIVTSIRKTAEEAGIKIVAGDTKVVNSGEVDKIFINTTGVGVFKREPLRSNSIKPGDKIILSGHIGNHSVHLLSVREGLGFETRVMSDCAPLNQMIHELLDSMPNGSVRAIRDVTRGGLSAVLHEFAKISGYALSYEEKSLPILHETEMACNMLGIDPINLANEGCICLFVDPESEENVLRILKSNKYGENSTTIGIVTSDTEPGVRSVKTDGSVNEIEELYGAVLPRLC